MPDLAVVTTPTLDRWEAWVTLERGLKADTTVKKYRADLEALESFAGPVETLTTQQLRDFLQHMGGKASTVAGRIAAMRSVYLWLIRTEQITRNPTDLLDRPKLHRGLPKPVPDLLSKLEHLAPHWKHTALFLYETGLRISEGYSIHIEPPAPETLYVIGKGTKERPVFLTKEARAALDELGGSLPFSPRSCQKAFSKLGFTPHKLRHSLACALIDSGADLGEVQEILGHASPATTRIYAQYKESRLRGAQARRQQQG